MRNARKTTLFWIVAACIIASISKSPQNKRRIHSPTREEARLESKLISMHGEAIATKELHNLFVHRIYHEDNLLQMRNYNFITANAFLAAGFAFVTTVSTKGVDRFAYVIAALGFLWAVFQVAYGKMQASATNLWRKQAWTTEAALNTNFDRTLFEFYNLRKTKTQFEIIEITTKKNRPPSKAFLFLYRLPYLLGFKLPFGVAVPWMVAAFWFALTCIMLQNNNLEQKVISQVAQGAMGFLLLLSLCCRTAYPQSKLDKYTLYTTKNLSC